MRRPLTNRIVGTLVAFAATMALAGAPGVALARSGGAGGSFQHGGFAGGGHNGPHGPVRFAHMGDRFHADDHFHEGDHVHDSDQFHDGLIPRGERPYNSPYADHSLMGSFFDGARQIWPIDFPFVHSYGAGDFQPCMRRDVYGDLYQAC